MKAVAFAVVTLTGLAALAQSSPPIRLCHVANAGFYIEAGDTAVLVDAILGDLYPGYGHPSDQLNEAIETAAPPFDKVGLVVISHYHGDHFDAPATLRFMEHNKAATVVAPPQAVEKMREAGLGPELEQRIIGGMPRDGGEAHSLAAIDIGVFTISHGAGRPIDNIGTLITVSGVSFFHPGDMFTTPAQLAEAGIVGLEVDYMLLPFWTLTDGAQLAAFTAGFKARNIVPMHLPIPEAAWLQGEGGYEAVLEKIFTSRPNLIRLEGEMDCLTVGTV